MDMKHRPLKQLCGLLATTAVALILIGCNGKAGQTGATGAAGATGPAGPAGPGGPTGPAATNTVNAALMSPEQWAEMKATVTVTNAVVTAGKPVVSFKIADPAGNGIKGLGGFTAQSATATLKSYPNLAFAIAKLVPEDTTATSIAPSKWVSYIVRTAPPATATATATRPSTDNTGTLVDNGDGTYQYTFYRDIAGMKAFIDGLTYTAPNAAADLGDLTYAPSLMHRVTVQFSGAARGTGSNTANAVTVASSVNMENPVNAIYDFVPATGPPVAAGADIRDVVSINKCNECHTKLAFHGGGRVEARYCVVCHTDQRGYGRAEATPGTTTSYTGSTYKIDGKSMGDMPTMVHKIHMGNELTKTGYNYANVLYDKLGYSMLGGGVRMCAKCHSDVPQADNWKAKPSRLACGSCHDGTNFATGHGTGVPAQLNDNACGICHLPADVTTYHMGENLTKHNPTVAAGLANFTYEISSAIATGTDVAVKFRIKNNGTAVTLAVPAATITQTVTGFTGSPSFLLAWAMPQDGIAAPTDYNNLLATGVPQASNFQPPTVAISALLDTDNAAQGAITGPDTSGYYTATILNTFPLGAKLRSFSLQGSFTQGSPPAARHTISVVKAVTGDTVRRTAIDSAKCANCHEWFEGHGGNRVYEVQVCVTCHVPGLTTSGKGGTNTQISNYYPSFTANDKDSLTRWTGVDFNTANPVAAYAAANPASPDIALLFPQTTNNMKDMIHGIHAGKDRTTPMRITRNRGGTQTIIDASRIGFPGILNNCQSCHTYNGYNVPTTGTLLSSREEAVNVAGNTTAALANTALATVNAGDLMITPFTAACVTCHDSVPAKAHMTLNGGQIKVVRSALNPALESCAVCHGAGSDREPVKVKKSKHPFRGLGDPHPEYERNNPDAHRIRVVFLYASVSGCPRHPASSEITHVDPLPFLVPGRPHAGPWHRSVPIRRGGLQAEGEVSGGRHREASPIPDQGQAEARGYQQRHQGGDLLHAGHRCVPGGEDRGGPPLSHQGPPAHQEHRDGRCLRFHQGSSHREAGPRAPLKAPLLDSKDSP